VVVAVVVGSVGAIDAPVLVSVGVGGEVRRLVVVSVVVDH